MLRPAHLIALCVLAMLTLGVVMVNSAGMTVHLVGSVDGVTQHDPGVTARSILMSRSTAYMGLALVTMTAGAMIPVRRLAARFGKPLPVDSNPYAGLMLVGLVCVVLIGLCALAYVPGLRREVKGSPRWIALTPGKNGLSMQPSEIAKWALLGLIAWYCVSRSAVLHRFWHGLVPALIAVGAVAGFIVFEDLGTGVLIAASACVVLLAAGARIWHFLMFLPPAILGLVVAVISNPYRIKRIEAFMDPYSDPEGKGYHVIQSLIAIANGHGTGRGLGHGLQKFDYLPEDKTDFIFAVICEELGIAGAALVVILFLGLMWSCSAVIRREREAILRLLSLGIVTTVGLQAFINLAVVTGMAPTKGIALPMLSSGGTGWIFTAFSLGLVMAIDFSRREEQPAASAIAPSRAPTTAIAT